MSVEAEYVIDARALRLIEHVEAVANGARMYWQAPREPVRVVAAEETRFIPDDGKRHWQLTLRQVGTAPHYGWTEWVEHWSEGKE